MSCQPIIINGECDPQIIEEDCTPVILTECEQGPPGIPGPPGPPGGAAFERVAGEPLSALRVVWEDPDGNVWPLDYRDDDHIDLLIGLTVTSGAAGAVVTVQRGGVMDVQGLGLVPGRVWLGAGGQLSQSPPDDGHDVLVGYVTSDSRVYLTFNESINLED